MPFTPRTPMVLSPLRWQTFGQWVWDAFMSSRKPYNLIGIVVICSGESSY